MPLRKGISRSSKRRGRPGSKRAGKFKTQAILIIVKTKRR